MKMLYVLLISTGTLSILSGCSSQYTVTFDSNPRGATLVCEGKNMGYTPKTLYFKEQVKKQDTLNISSCSANWVSGAKKPYGIIPVTQYPDGVRQTLEREQGDGYSKDAEFALKMRQTEALESAAYQQRRAATAAEKQNNKTTTCYTNFGITNCY